MIVLQNEENITLVKQYHILPLFCLEKAKKCDTVLPQCNMKSPKTNRKLQQGEEEIGKDASHSYCPRKGQCNISASVVMRFSINLLFSSDVLLKLISLSCQNWSPCA